MKYLYIAALFLFAAQNANAQNYDELLELIVDEKYERCLYKAVKYTEDDKTKNDPLPYGYMSMAFFRIANMDDPTLKEKYPKADKDAVKYLIKFRKKDKDNAFLGEFQDFISEVRVAAISEAEQQSDSEKYTKSKGLYKQLTDIDTNDPGAWLMRGYNEWMMKAKKDALTSYDNAKKLLKEQGVANLRKEQLDLLKMGVIRNAEMLNEIGERASARELLELAEDHFKNDKEFNVVYSIIIG
jgi:hypothetical protein